MYVTTELINLDALEEGDEKEEKDEIWFPEPKGVQNLWYVFQEVGEEAGSTLSFG